MWERRKLNLLKPKENYDYFQYWTEEIYKTKWAYGRRKRKGVANLREYINLLNTHIRKKYTNVLEVGCGWGLWIKDYPFCGIDINLQRLNIAKKHKCTVIRGDLTQLPFKDKSFEASYSIQVLMHIPPTHIKKALRELIRVTQKKIFHIEVYSTKKRRLAKHCFNHNWKRLYRNLGINLIYFKRLTNYKNQVCVMFDLK